MPAWPRGGAARVVTRFCRRHSGPIVLLLLLLLGHGPGALPCRRKKHHPRSAPSKQGPFPVTDMLRLRKGPLLVTAKSRPAPSSQVMHGKAQQSPPRPARLAGGWRRAPRAWVASTEVSRARSRAGAPVGPEGCCALLPLLRLPLLLPPVPPPRRQTAAAVITVQAP